jgi:hypothetical protein
VIERLFLVRRQSNRIEGPFSRREVLDQLENGQLASQDEIAPAGSYWFQCHEGKEIERWVGSFELDKTVIESDDLTLTMNRNVSDLARDAKVASSLSPDEEEVTDPMLSTGGLKAGGSSPTGRPALKPVESFRVEGASYWKWLAVVLIPLVALVVYRVLGLARFF